MLTNLLAYQRRTKRRWFLTKDVYRHKGHNPLDEERFHFPGVMNLMKIGDDDRRRSHRRPRQLVV